MYSDKIEVFPFTLEAMYQPHSLSLSLSLFEEHQHPRNKTKNPEIASSFEFEAIREVSFFLINR